MNEHQTNRVAHYLERAAEVRAIAEDMKDAMSRRHLFDIAAEYEMLAEAMANIARSLDRLEKADGSG